MADKLSDIAFWQRIDPHLTTSGRLAAADLDRLHTAGVTHVINLALADSPGILRNEADEVALRGMHYTHIPVPFNAPAEPHFAAFSKAMAESEGHHVHVHCVRNWRVSAFIYRWHRDERAMPEAQARLLMAQQWVPEASDHQDAPAWARFIAGARGTLRSSLGA